MRYLHLMHEARHVFKTETPFPVRDSCGVRARCGAYNHRPRRGRASSKSYNAAIGENLGFGDLVGSVHGRAVRGRMVIDHQGCRGGGWWAVLLRAGERCGFLNGYTLPVATATRSVHGWPTARSAANDCQSRSKGDGWEIDPLDNIKRQKIYLFHGYNDAVVAKSVTDATAEFYRRYLGEPGRGNLYYQESRGAGHSFVVTSGRHELAPTRLTEARSSINAVTIKLASFFQPHIYRALVPGTIGHLGASIRSFDHEPVYRQTVSPDAFEHMGDERLRVRSKRMRDKAMPSSPCRAPRLSAAPEQ